MKNSANALAGNFAATFAVVEPAGAGVFTFLALAMADLMPASSRAVVITTACGFTALCYAEFASTSKMFALGASASSSFTAWLRDVDISPNDGSGPWATARSRADASGV